MSFIIEQNSVFLFTSPLKTDVFYVSFSRSEDSNKRPPGTPGTPGSRDLEAALRRLSLRRDNYLSEKRFFEEERERKLAYLAKQDEKGGGESSGGPGTPTESLLSLCSHPSLGSVWSGYSFTARSYLPEKLQIVKPLEGDYSSQSHESTNHSQSKKENQNLNVQKAFHNENERLKKNLNLKQNSKESLLNTPKNYTQTDQTQSQVPQNQQQTQYLIFHNRSESKIFLSASLDRNKLRRSSSLLELSGLSRSQPPRKAPLALATGLLEVVEQQEGSLNLQHTFYFRHTQPRCWFEI